MVHFFVVVAVFLSIEIYESTTGEYGRTQQDLTKGFGGVDGEGLVVWWMVVDCGGGSSEVVWFS